MPDPVEPNPPSGPPSRLAQLDAWMNEGPFAPRFLPFFAWLAGMLVVGLAHDHVSPWALPPLYALQCALVIGLLWRYRKLTPELNLRFHWSVIPSALLLTAAWMVLGWWMAGELGFRWSALMEGELLPRQTAEDLAARGIEPNDHTTTTPGRFEEMQELSTGLYVSALALRLVGMAAIVPLFEELFIRSLCLRACSSAKATGLGLLQLLEDLPVVGDWLIDSSITRPAAGKPPQFNEQFIKTPLGGVTLFGVLASTVIFTASHIPRDWLGCAACGVVWCAMVWWTNRAALPEGKRLGLGPVVWSHGLVNALLWVYSWTSGDWQFL